MSSPHFYQAEQKFVDAVFGMKPNKEQHQTTIDVNPVGKSKPSLPSPAEVLSVPGCGCWADFPCPARGRCGAALPPSPLAEVPGTELSPKISCDEAYRTLSGNNHAKPP